MKDQETEKRNHTRRRLFRIFFLCCGGGEDNEVYPDMSCGNHIRQPMEDTNVVENSCFISDRINITQPIVNVGSMDRQKLARWKAETRVAEWRAAAIAFREGQITEINPKSFIEKDLLGVYRTSLRDGSKFNNSTDNLVNTKHTIKFKPGNLETLNFFDSMELPEPNKTGKKTLIWNVIIKQSC
uniref:Uncharacterized protein n=1 Tax=Rhodnius prolixus TaxID=13249 RepID=T1I806_RHOPR